MFLGLKELQGWDGMFSLTPPPPPRLSPPSIDLDIQPRCFAVQFVSTCCSCELWHYSATVSVTLGELAALRKWVVIFIIVQFTPSHSCRCGHRHHHLPEPCSQPKFQLTFPILAPEKACVHNRTVDLQHECNLRESVTWQEVMHTMCIAVFAFYQL